MTSPDTITDASALREELECAEARVRSLRASNAALQRTLLRPSEFRTAAVATVAGAVLAGTVAYWTGAKVGDMRAARENDLAEKAHALRIWDPLESTCRHASLSIL